MYDDFSREMRIKIAQYRNSLHIFYKMMGKRRLRRVDIYGAGKIGKDLYALCQESGISVDTLIDKNIKKMGLLPLITVANYKYKSDVDAVIVTVMGEYKIVTNGKGCRKRQNYWLFCTLGRCLYP